MARKVLGLVDCYNNPNFGPMTKHRAIASTSFLGRYAFIDFPLSNFTNSGIEYFGVLCQNHIRSLSRHVGSGRAWTSNTKIGEFGVLYDEPNVQIPGYNTDVSNLEENMWFLKQISPDYVILTPAHMIYEADFNQLLEDHIASGARISVLYTHQTGLKSHFINARKIYVTEHGKITKTEVNKGDTDEGDISLGALIMDYQMLLSMMDYAKGTSSFFNISDTLNYLAPTTFVRAVPVSGYVRSFDSLSHYLKYSLELLDEATFHDLFHENWPIFTKTYDTPPVLYKSGSHVENSYIANGSIIEGTVINSILGRGVRVKKGVVIKNSVIGSDAVIDENTHIEAAVVDKEAQVLHISEVMGSLDDPLYIARGDIV
ncbi:MAG: glucose-1-phosphate adenylyltransferase subunit GlgD [Bacilli bacterium]|jgi:glucose-1-phosphate adenylyltransferase|nr:glucose-1-phosphate adenylyltransferase subunit GlgD [Bacilli bacterium]